ncbi:hypothetical protein KR067_012520 [Drosophila pandora]|nr:hypothetical protein KR067_012520 [Drosophila pandora]
MSVGDESFSELECSDSEARRSYNEIKSLLWETMDVLGGGPVSKNEILRMLSLTTDKHPMALVDDVEEIIDDLVSRGLLRKLGNNYTIVKRRGELSKLSELSGIH